MKKVIFATGNEGKMKEIREILGDLDIQLLSLKDAGITADIEENGNSFEENAVIKATAIRDLTGEIVLADDSGLEIDYLNKEPGIYSARYMGEDTSYHIKNAILLSGWTEFLMKRELPALCVPLQPLSRTGLFGQSELLWKAGSATRKKVKTDLAMTPFFIFRNTDVLLQSFPWRKKIKSATEGRL